MKKRILFCVILIILATVVLLSCGCENSDTSNNSKNEQSDNLSSSNTATTPNENDSSNTNVTKYTVSFDSCGGTEIESQTIEQNSKAVKPTDPTKTGCVFDGWYCNGEKWSFVGYVVTENITLIAKWITIDYEISYDLNGGTLENEKSIFTVESETFEIEEPKKIGYSFMGWSGTDISGNPKTITIVKGSYGHKFYTANWQAKPYTISLDADGGSVSSFSKTVEYDAKTTLPIPNKQGYTFAGWYKGTTQITNANGEMLSAWNFDSDSSLKAKWNPNANTAYTVKHYQENANDNGYTLKETETLFGITDSIVSPNTKTYTGFSAPSKATVTISADGSTVLEYRYTRSLHTVTFVTNGGNAIDSMAVKYQQTVILPVVEREGFTFGGWFTNVALTTEFQGAASSNITLYVWWKEETKPSCFNYIGDESITISKYIGDDTTIMIPTYIGNVLVKEISIDAFRKSSIISVKIPDCVETIGKYAFAECKQLETCIIGNGVSTIPRAMLLNCASLESLSIGNNITTIGDFALDGCSSLVEIHILDMYQWCSITWSPLYNSIPFACEYDLYLNDTIVKKLVIPNEVTVINKYVFAKCKSIETVFLHSRVETIQNCAFYNCTGLTNIEIPDSVTYLGSATFEGCSNLTTVSIGRGITELRNYLFGSCTNLKEFAIPNTIISIEYCAFAYCYSLKTIVIPLSVTTMGSNVFYDCDITINCEVAEKPSGWDEDWDYHCPDVNWFYKG